MYEILLTHIFYDQDVYTSQDSIFTAESNSAKKISERKSQIPFIDDRRNISGHLGTPPQALLQQSSRWQAATGPGTRARVDLPLMATSYVLAS